MPKNRKVIKKDGHVFKMKNPSKFRIGTRKNGVSAHMLSTAKLLEVVMNKPKYKHIAHAVLALRNHGMLKQLKNNMA